MRNEISISLKQAYSNYEERDLNQEQFETLKAAMAKAEGEYHEKTGFAGYTLVYHSRGMQLVQHEPFSSTKDAIERGTDIKSQLVLVENSTNRVMVKDTDLGKNLQRQIDDLKKLLYAYRGGFIKEEIKKLKR